MEGPSAVDCILRSTFVWTLIEYKHLFPNNEAFYKIAVSFKYFNYRHFFELDKAKKQQNCV